MEIPEIIQLAQSATKDNFIGNFARAIQGLADYAQQSESPVATRDSRIWHYSWKCGVRICGNDDPNSCSTEIIPNVTCRECLQRMAGTIYQYCNAAKGSFVPPRTETPTSKTAGEVAAEKYVSYSELNQFGSQIRFCDLALLILNPEDNETTQSESFAKASARRFTAALAAIIDAERTDEREQCAKIADLALDKLADGSYISNLVADVSIAIRSR